MDHEFDPKSNDQQDKRQRAQNDLEELLQLMSQMNIDKPAASEPKTVHKVELPKQEEVSAPESEIEDVQQAVQGETATEPEEITEPQETEEAEAEQPEEELSGEQLAAEIMAEIMAEKAVKEDQTEQEEAEADAEAEAAAQSVAADETPETLEEEPEMPTAETEDPEQKLVEEILNQQAKKHHPDQPMATMYLGEKGKKQAEADKKAQPKKRRLTKKEREARLRKKRIQRMCVLGAMLLVVVLILVSCVRAVMGIGGGANGSGSGVVAGSSEEVKDTRPASEQECEQYEAIKDETTLPSYALEYPGMYSDAVAEENKAHEEKVCYLTFDDGPSSSNTPKLLDILKEKGVKATFFVVASEIEGSEDVLKRIVEEGHTLCIHANEHDYAKIYQSTEAFLEDFAAAYDKIYEVTGYRVQGFRFPGGSNNGTMSKNGTYDEIVTEMTRRGFEYYDWNAYNHDSEGGNYTVEQMVEFAVSEVNGSSREDVILLMHDTYGKDKTVAALSDIIDQLQAAGIELLPIDNTTRPVHFSVSDSTPEEMPTEEAPAEEDGGENSTDEEE